MKKRERFSERGGTGSFVGGDVEAAMTTSDEGEGCMRE